MFGADKGAQMEPFVFEAKVDVDFNGIPVPRGARIVVEPGAPEPVVSILRDLTPNYGLLLDLAERGVLRQLTYPRPLADLALAVGYPLPSPAPDEPPRPARRPWRRPRHLRLV